MPTVNDEFNRSCVRIDLDPGCPGVFVHAEVTLWFSAGDLRVFNACAQRVAPGTRPFGAEQIVAAARRVRPGRGVPGGLSRCPPRVAAGSQACVANTLFGA